MNRHYSALMVAVLVVGAAQGQRDRDQARLLGTSTTTAGRLKEAQKLVDAKQWNVAVDKLQEIQGSVGDDLVFTADSHYISARWMAHAIVAKMPGEGLTVYRQRKEGEAKKWLQQGKKLRRPELLRRVIEEAFCTESAEEAVLLLGDIAFEQGRFHEAERWWGLLSPLPTSDKGSVPFLLYPSPKTPPAQSQARQMLARWFGKTVPAHQWHQDLKRFRKRYPKASGYLAGREGICADILQSVAENEPQIAAADAKQWPTAMGSSDRHRALIDPKLTPTALSQLRRFGHQWSWSLPGQEKATEGRAVTSVRHKARSVAFYPVIVRARAIVADATSIWAHNLKTGKKQQWYVLDAEAAKGISTDFPPPVDLRYTISVGEDCLIARMGAPALSQPEEKEDKVPQSLLVCLNLNPGKDMARLRWRLALKTDPPAIFEGSPILTENRAFVAVTRLESGREVTAVHCYPLAGNDTPKPLWIRDICSSPTTPVDKPRYQHQLLTLSGSRLYYCTHTGAIACLSAETGKPVWAVQYKSRAGKVDVVPATRDMAPCMVVGRRCYVAPTDADVVFCLDSDTGQSLWSRDGIRPLQLLGTGQGNLILTTSAPVPGIRALSSINGSDQWYQKAIAPPHPTTWGRGALVNNLILWPTRARWYALRQKDGQQPRDPTLLQHFPRGNLAYGQGAVVIADRDRLYAYVPAGSVLPQRKEKVKEDPASAKAHLFLGKALADHGLIASAIDQFKQSQQVPGPWQVAARRAEHRAWLDAADRIQDTRPLQAIELLEHADRKEAPLDLRMQAIQKMVHLRAISDGRDKAVSLCRAVLKDADLQSTMVIDRHGLPQRAQVWAAMRIAQLQNKAESREPTLDVVLHDANPDLSLPLTTTWHRTIRGKYFLSASQPEGRPILFSTDPDRRLACHSTGTGKPVWKSKLPFTAQWLDHLPTGLLVAGSEGVALVSSEGRLRWSYSLTSLSAFQLSPDRDRLFFLRSHRQLMAMDVQTGRTQWSTECPAAVLRKPHKPAVFLPRYEIHGSTITAPLAGGEHLLIDIATGKVQAQWQATVTDIAARKPGRAAVEWSYSFPHPSTLLHTMPERIDADNLHLAIVGRNYGWTLERLSGGKLLWTSPVVLSESVDAMRTARDGQSWYIPSGDRIISIDLATGKQNWTTDLPKPWRPWRCLVRSGMVIAYPVQSASYRFSFRWPLGSVEWYLTPGRTETVSRTWPLHIYDAKTGKLQQSMALAAGLPQVSRGSQPKPGPSHGWTAKGFIITEADRAWLLQSSREQK